MGMIERQKERARAAIKRAIQRGALVRPEVCQRCGALDRKRVDGRSAIHAHHHRGYEHPLDVEWLCPTCHFSEDHRPAKERNGRAKITMEIAREIRRRHVPGCTWKNPANSSKALAREFGLCDRTVGSIIRNELWIDTALAGEGKGI